MTWIKKMLALVDGQALEESTRALEEATLALDATSEKIRSLTYE